MATFILLPGAGGTAWYWHRVAPLLEQAGQVAIAVDFPGDDPDAGLNVYADLVMQAIGDRDDVTLVAQSMGGFTADFQARVARERLGLDVDVLPGGHLNALSYPGELAEQLLTYVDSR